MRKVIKWLAVPAVLCLALLAAPTKQAQAGPWGFYFGWGFHRHWGYPHAVYHPGHFHYHPGHFHVSPWGSFYHPGHFHYHPGHFHYFCD